jgi:hypothetical protein
MTTPLSGTTVIPVAALRESIGAGGKFANSPTQPGSTTKFPARPWWVAGFSWELGDAPIACTLLNRPMVGHVGSLRHCRKAINSQWKRI